MEHLACQDLDLKKIQKSAFFHSQREEFDEELFFSKKLLDCQPFNQNLIARICFLIEVLDLKDELGFYYEKLIKKDLFFNFMGEHFFKNEKFKNALLNFSKSLKTDRENVFLICRIASCLYQLKKKNLAFKLLQGNIKKKPDFDHLWIELGIFWLNERDLMKSKKCLIQSLLINPNNFFSNYNLALVLNKSYEPKESLYYSEQALKIDPNNSDTYNVMGNSHKIMGNFEKAIDCYQKCLMLKPEHTDALGNMGSCYEKMNQFKEAEKFYQKALSFEKKSHEITSNYALLMLREKRFDPGWLLYEERVKLANSNIGIKEFNFPYWNGEDLNGKVLFLWSEQGIGDQIMSLFVLNELNNKYQNLTIIFQTDKRLKEIIERSFNFSNSNQFFFYKKEKPHYQSSILSLLRFFRRGECDFEKSKPYLFAEPKDRLLYKEKSQDLKRLGISWKTKNKENGLQRSCPILTWKPFLESLSGWDIFSVQYSDVEKEVHEYNHGSKNPIKIESEINPMKDLDRFSSFLSSMDCVVSIDNSTVHLCGALGVKTFVLLPFHADWRWFSSSEEGEGSLWYPCVSIWRQTYPGDWRGIFEKLNLAF